MTILETKQYLNAGYLSRHQAVDQLMLADVPEDEAEDIVDRHEQFCDGLISADEITTRVVVSLDNGEAGLTIKKVRTLIVILKDAVQYAIRVAYQTNRNEMWDDATSHMDHVNAMVRKLNRYDDDDDDRVCSLSPYTGWLLRQYGVI